MVYWIPSTDNAGFPVAFLTSVPFSENRHKKYLMHEPLGTLWTAWPSKKAPALCCVAVGKHSPERQECHEWSGPSLLLLSLPLYLPSFSAWPVAVRNQERPHFCVWVLRIFVLFSRLHCWYRSLLRFLCSRDLTYHAGYFGSNKMKLCFLSVDKFWVCFRDWLTSIHQ